MVGGVLGGRGAHHGAPNDTRLHRHRHAPFHDCHRDTISPDPTFRTFELEPGVCAQVTANWDKPLSSREFYNAFLGIAQELGYVVVEDGLLTKIQLAPDTPKDPTPPCRRYPVRNAG